MTNLLRTTEDKIADLRESIDSVDLEIIKLLIRRRGYSQVLQSVKATVGLPQTELSREREIIETYGIGLAHGGDFIAANILSYCKHKES